MAGPLAAAPRTARLVSVSLVAWWSVSFCALSSFYLPLSVVPSQLLARGAGPVAAGWVMAVLVLHAVAAELLAPRAVARAGPSVVAVAGLALMALSGIGVALSSAVGVVLLLTAARGFGFGLVVVVVAARVAALLPVDRRGEGLGWAGVVAGVPAVAGLPLGLWLADRYGATTASTAAALAALAGLTAIPWVGRQPNAVGGSGPRQPAGPGQPAGLRVVAAARRPQQRRPATVFLAVVAGAGVVIAFVPSLPLVTPRLAGAAVLVHSLSATGTRLLAGIHGDRHGHRAWLWFGVLGSVAGFAALASSASALVLLVAMTLTGAAFGAAQSASLTLMVEDARPEHLPTVSALWNASYDLGLGLGPLLFGVALAAVSPPAALLLVVGALAACIPSVLRS